MPDEEALSPGCNLHVHYQRVAGVHHTVTICTKQHLSNPSRTEKATRMNIPVCVYQELQGAFGLATRLVPTVYAQDSEGLPSSKADSTFYSNQSHSSS